jgi:aspartate/methionine/tyrosine aminotransferase
MSDRRSSALRGLPPYPFVALEEKARQLELSGTHVLRFAIGDPDLPPPPPLLDAARAALADPRNHGYSSSRGRPELRAAIARVLHRRFGVTVDPEREVAVLLGSKEGLAALPRAILEPGDRVAVPDPGYPAYVAAVHLAGGRAVPFPLEETLGWLPDWDRFPRDVRLAYLNYPNNPTGAGATLEALAPMLAEAQAQELTVAYDNAYSELGFGPDRPPSILQLPGAVDHCVEFHSLSKTFGVAGWRIGFVVGNEAIVRALVALKGNQDSGAAAPLEAAAAAGLDLYTSSGWPAEVRRSFEEYAERSRRLSEGLRSLGYEVTDPAGTLYVWQRAPEGDGTSFAETLLRTHGLLVTPGAAFGGRGAGWVRWSVTCPIDQVREALERLGKRFSAARGVAGGGRSPSDPEPAG